MNSPADLDDSDDGRVVSAVKDYMKLLDAGEAPSQEEFLKQHSDIAQELRPSLEGLALVHQAADPRPELQSMVPPDAEFTAKPIGDFQIVGELGRGGMGVVYEAIQLSLGRHVALKVLPFASGLDEVRLQRFRNESHAAAALHHTNIVPVYAVGSDRGVHYYAMQMIDGSTLAELIDNMRDANQLTIDQLPDSKKSTAGVITERKERKSGPDEKANESFGAGGGNETVARHSTILSESMPGRKRYFRSVVHMIQQAATAIQHAHQYGVVHRDIKPANLLLDSTGKIWVTDFGLAQVQTEASQLTRTGDPMGTLRYMSPEQAAGDRVELDHRSDIYSLGVTLYELLTLRPAIIGNGYREMLNHVALHDPRPPKAVDPAIPIELDTIVRKAIAKAPADRYSTAGALADDLQAWLDDKPIAAKPPTTLERLTKWRRRNNGLVLVASGLLLFSTLGLLASTLMIWQAKQRTSAALQSEMQQRQQSQRSFQQARSAVETFSSLSETELAYRPDLQDLRRRFLETSLEFYRDFLVDWADDPNLAKELASTSDKVKKMVEELRILDSISPLRALTDRRVQNELGIENEKIAVIEEAVEEFNEQRRSLANQFEGGLTTENTKMTEMAREFSRFISGQLSETQMKRLRQIVRQQRLPFTFKSSEVVNELQLTRQQRTDINRIIEETGPNRHGGKMSRGRGGFGLDSLFFYGPRRNGPPPGGPGTQGARGAQVNGDDPRSHMFGRPRPPEIENTVRQIVLILTDKQVEKWKVLIGEPFRF